MSKPDKLGLHFHKHVDMYIELSINSKRYTMADILMLMWLSAFKYSDEYKL